MDGHRLDPRANTLAAAVSRRAVLRRLGSGSGGLAALLAIVGLARPSRGAWAAATPVPTGERPLGATRVAAPVPGTDLRVTAQRAIDLPDARLIALSPDGRWLAAVKPAQDYAHGQLCVYDIDTLAERSCADLAGLGAGVRLADVTWSPDGSHLAFAEETFKYLVDGDLWLMDTTTGTLTNLDDDGFAGELPLFGGTPNATPISLPVNPTFSPDGRSVAFSRSVILHGKPAGNDLAVVPVAGGTPQTVTRVTLVTPGVVSVGIHWAPDASRLYYSVSYPDPNDPHNGIWVVDATGFNQRHLVGTTDSARGAPAVVQVSPRGDKLLAFYPIAAGQYSYSGPVYALVDVASGTASPLTLQHPTAPAHAYVSLATFSPDGSTLLTVSSLTDPDHQVAVRAVDGGAEVALVPQGVPSAGPVAWGLLPTWATNGTVFLTGGAALSHGTLLALAGSAATPIPAPPAARPPANLDNRTPFGEHSLNPGL